MSITYTKDDHDIVTLTLDRPDHSTNIIDGSFSQALSSAIARLELEEELAGVIVTSAKKTFLAGADLESLAAIEDPSEARRIADPLKTEFRKLETLGKPVVAAINGTALGGGLELALACHHRIVIDGPGIKLGLPEVTLGLIPGLGGIVRLPRMLGLQSAMPYLLEGKQIGPQAALEAGMVDDLATDGDELSAKAKAWIETNPDASQPWDRKGFKIPGGGPSHPKVAQMLAAAPAMLRQKTRRNYPAPEAILSVAVEGSAVDIDTASAIESRYFAGIAAGTVAKNMIKAFWFDLNEIKGGASRPQGAEPSGTRKVGVLGAGMMGHGIAHVTASNGMDVVMKDVSVAQAEAGRATIEAILDKRVARGRMTTEKKAAILDRILATDSAKDLDGCDLIIEAVFEDRDLKARVTAEAEAQIDAEAVFGSNTSTLPITGLAERSTRPQNFVGVHFFSPVHRMPLVELIRGEQTSDQTLAKVFDYVLEIGKTPIVVNDSRGFFTSRVFATYLNEGMALLADGQHPRAIESAGLQAGMPVGPLALTDEVSLSLVSHIREQTAKDLAAEGKEAPEHPAHGVIDIMVAGENRLGKAHGAGFYDYPADDEKSLWSELRTLFPPSGEKLAQTEMKDRLLFIQALEAARCYEEKVVTSVADANIGSIFGWGFAPFTGGVLQFMNTYGIADFVARSRTLSERHGDRFSPPELLKKMAEDNATF